MRRRCGGRYPGIYPGSRRLALGRNIATWLNPRKNRLNVAIFSLFLRGFRQVAIFIYPFMQFEYGSVRRFRLNRENLARYD